VVVVDELDERLDFRSLLYSLLPHAAGDFGWVAFNAGDQGVCERMCLCGGIDGLDYDDLVISESDSVE
jgi:hypothetical protein